MQCRHESHKQKRNGDLHYDSRCSKKFGHFDEHRRPVSLATVCRHLLITKPDFHQALKVFCVALFRSPMQRLE